MKKGVTFVARICKINVIFTIVASGIPIAYTVDIVALYVRGIYGVGMVLNIYHIISKYSIFNKTKTDGIAFSDRVCKIKVIFTTVASGMYTDCIYNGYHSIITVGFMSFQHTL